MIIAHRGYSSKYPENTFTAVKAAFEEAKADGIEIDVHLTRDFEIILQHDENLDRMTVGGSGKVCDRPWNGYIDSLKTKGSLIDEPVALLSQILQYLSILPNPNPILVLDVKDDQSLQILDELVKLLQNYNLKRCKIYLGLWRDDFALRARQLCSNLNVIITLISDECNINRVNSDLYDAFNLDVDRVSEEVIEEANKLGKDVLLWTCNTSKQINRANELNIQAILTDDPTKIKI